MLPALPNERNMQSTSQQSRTRLTSSVPGSRQRSPAELKPSPPTTIQKSQSLIQLQPMGAGLRTRNASLRSQASFTGPGHVNSGHSDHSQVRQPKQSNNS